MNHTLSKLALGTSLVLLTLPSGVLAGRGGGGGGYGGGGGGHGYGGGQMGGGSMGHSPSFSQPRQPSGQSGSGSYGNHSQYGNQSGSSANHPAGAAAAGAGYANHNQTASHPAGAAAAGAGYANNNQSLNHPGAAGAAAGAGYANNNQSLNHSGAAGAAAGAGYANNHSGINGAWGATGYGAGLAGYGATGYGTGVGAWGVGSPMYGWGYSGYSNPYSAGYSGAGAVSQPVVAQQPAAPAYNYSQPINTTAAPPEQPVANQANAGFDQARDAFKAGDYDKALQLDQQALAQTPNDRTLHEFLALVFFAQGKYDQAAEPLYAVLSVAPGWDWTTLSGMYADVDTYTGQLRTLEASIRSNPQSAHARFVLAYQYLCQGHVENAVAQLKAIEKLQPADTLSAQLIAYYQPAGATQSPSAETASNGAPAFAGKLAGSWIATPVKDTKIALLINDDGTFTWDATAPGKPAMNIAGKSSLADGLLTLDAKGGQNGALVGKVAWKDSDNFTFRVVGAPSTDPGLRFAR